ncbi:hypothetical protein EVAR_69985_1 [Eumeta japonica]|uniref:Uncharacterized protein n=1 Tax=Eumeta variegata TaxID=151549 RepID=A0A4C1ZF69_EUMVA|nr:hypothetical protein EVAR_69985_1 [Eumeta japonica]
MADQITMRISLGGIGAYWTTLSDGSRIFFMRRWTLASSAAVRGQLKAPEVRAHASQQNALPRSGLACQRRGVLELCQASAGARSLNAGWHAAPHSDMATSLFLYKYGNL